MILSSSFMLEWLKFLIINIICSFPSLSSPSSFGSWFFGGFLNQQFPKVKPREERKDSLGRGEGVVVIVACWFTVIFCWPQHYQLVCNFLAFDTWPQLGGMVTTASGHLFTRFLHVSVFHTDENLLIFIKGSGPWGNVKEIWISNICFDNPQKFPYTVPAGQSLYLGVSYHESSIFFPDKHLCLTEIKDHFKQMKKKVLSWCLVSAFWGCATKTKDLLPSCSI